MTLVNIYCNINLANISNQTTSNELFIWKGIKTRPYRKSENLNAEKIFNNKYRLSTRHNLLLIWISYLFQLFFSSKSMPVIDFTDYIDNDIDLTVCLDMLKNTLHMQDQNSHLLCLFLIT